MPAPEQWLAGVMLVALIAYAVTGGADFGGGVWDLFARGPRAEAQRELIARAIAPIWEANHVWLILVVVLLFVAFPPAFAAIGTALHVPLSLMLIGIVLRGSAFTFRSYDSRRDLVQRRWSRVFAIASTVTPVTLGMCVGAIAAGGVPAGTGPRPTADWFLPWLAPFPVATGALTLALFAFLAATYLTLETRDEGLREDFRVRALASGVGSGVLAFAGLALAADGAPRIFEGLTARAWSLPFQLVTAAAALTALGALATRRYALARAAAAAQVGLVVLGWGLAQHPHVLPPSLTFEAAAAPPVVLRLTLAALAAGTIVLAPSLVWLFRVFKRGTGLR